MFVWFSWSGCIVFFGGISGKWHVFWEGQGLFGLGFL